MLTALTASSQAQTARRVRLVDDHIVIQKRYLKTLVEKLEAEKWLRRKNSRLGRELMLVRELASSQREELAGQKRLTLRLKESLTLAQLRLKTANKRVSILELNSADYREIQKEAVKIDKTRKKQVKNLRRRLAGQKIALWTVSAVGGALLILLLL